MTPKPPNKNGSPDPKAQQPNPPPPEPGTKKPETTPAEERGERLDTAKSIARGGKAEGHVPGADPDE